MAQDSPADPESGFEDDGGSAAPAAALAHPPPPPTDDGDTAERADGTEDAEDHRSQLDAAPAARVRRSRSARLDGQHRAPGPTAPVPARGGRGRGRGTLQHAARVAKALRRQPLPPAPPKRRAPSAAAHASPDAEAGWSRPDIGAEWFLADDDEEDETEACGAGLAGILPPPAFAALPSASAAAPASAARKKAKNQATAVDITGGSPPAPAPPSVSAATSRLGLFRAQHEHVKPPFADVRPRTQAERNAITAADVTAVFCPLRRSEITRPRIPADDLAATAAIKAHRTLTAYNWPTDSIDRELFCIITGARCSSDRACRHSRSGSS